MVLMVLIEWDSHYIFNQIFLYHIIFVKVMDRWKITLVFSSNRKNCIRMKIHSIAFLAIAITITLLTNRCCYMYLNR